MPASRDDTRSKSDAFVFIAHNDCDKHLLVPVIGQLLDDGVNVMIDRVYAFDQFDEHLSSGRLQQMHGGQRWEAHLIEILESEACACVLGFVSLSSSRLDHPDDHHITRLEIREARKLKKLLLIEIEADAMKAFWEVPHAHNRSVADLQHLMLRDERFSHDYDLLGDSVNKLTHGRIRFGGRLSFDRLAEEQMSLADALRGSRSRITVNRYDATDRCFRCRLVPGDGTSVENFWLTDAPVAEAVCDVAEVEGLLDDARGFRLPTEAQLYRALAPLGPDMFPRNPFGFAIGLARGAWAQRGKEIVVAGGSGRPPASVLLVYTG